MILSDVVPLQSFTPAKNAKPYKEVEELTNNFLSGLGFLQGLERTSEEGRSLSSLAEKGRKKLDSAIIKVSQQTGDTTLPDTLLKYNSVGVKIAASPRAELAELRKIADLLGFLILPYEYLNSESFGRESYEMRYAIEGFSTKVSEWFTPYVITPPIYYDVQGHVDSAEDLPIYSGPLTAQAIMALNMSLPMFRSILRNLKELVREHRDIQQQIHGVNREIESIKGRLSALEAYVEQQIRAKIQEEKAKEVAAKIAAAQRQSLISHEPMLIGIPKGKTVNDDCSVIVGPCWGPDFQDIVFTALNLKKITGQREYLALTTRSLSTR